MRRKFFDIRNPQNTSSGILRIRPTHQLGEAALTQDFQSFRKKAGMFKLFTRPAAPITNAVRSVSLLSGIFGSATMDNAPLQVRPYTPAKPDGPFPYSTRDMTPTDAGNDSSFYGPARFVTHIDDNAIVNLKKYYDAELPRQGTILDFCSSWVSHYPPDVFNRAKKRDEFKARKEALEGAGVADNDAQDTLTVLGTGMNQAELKANPLLWKWSVQDLNEDAQVHLPQEQGVKLDASTCVVSIDYLTKPVEVLKNIRSQTNTNGRVHLAISNRCFPTKVVGRWLKVSEQDRLEMVGDYLHWAGWCEIEIVDVVKGGFMTDPLWVVRARNIDSTAGQKSEL